MRIGIGIGSNLEDRRLWLERAFDFLRTLDPKAKFSQIYESSPVDCPAGSGAFLNAAAELEWEGELEILLDRLQAFETACGRRPPGERGLNQPRAVDVDILYADDLALATKRLILPHPRLGERLFVLLPLAELCPDRRLPGDRETLREKSLGMAKALERQGQLCRPLVQVRKSL